MPGVYSHWQLQEQRKRRRNRPKPWDIFFPVNLNWRQFSTERHNSSRRRSRSFHRRASSKCPIIQTRSRRSTASWTISTLCRSICGLSCPASRTSPRRRHHRCSRQCCHREGPSIRRRLSLWSRFLPKSFKSSRRRLLRC